MKDAADVVFEALGIIFKISGKTSFRVRISGHDSGLLQADALGFLSSTIDAANVAIEGCFGLDTTIFGVDVELKLDETCLPLDKDKVADIFVSIAGKVWEIVKDKIVMRAVDELKKLWGDFSTRAMKIYDEAIDYAKAKVKELLFDRIKTRGGATYPDAAKVLK